MKEIVQWLIKDKDGHVDGPFTTTEIVRKIRSGLYMGEEFISKYPSGRWHPISHEESFFNVLLEVLEEDLGGQQDPITKETDLEQDVQYKTIQETLKSRKGRSINADEETEVQHGRLISEDLDSKTPLIIDVEDKGKRGRAVQDQEAQKSKPKKTKKRKKKKRAKKKKELSRRAKRARVQAVLFLGLCVILYMAVFHGQRRATGEKRFHLQRPRTGVKEKMSRAQSRATMSRAVTVFRKDTVGNYIKAQDALVEIIEKTNSLDAYSFLCMTYRELWPHSFQDGRDFKTVQDVLRKIQKINPKSPSASVCLVVFHWISGKYDQALRIMDVHLNQSKNLIFFNQMSGDIYATRKKYQVANYYFSKVRELWSPPPVWSKALLQEARMYRKLRQFGGAIRLYKKLLRENPSHAVGQIELGILEYDAYQHINKSSDHIKSGLSTKQFIPKMIESEAYATLAKINLVKGDRKRALKNSQKAFSLDSSNQEARQLVVSLGGLKALNAVAIDNVNMVYIGEQYMKMGNYTAAQAEFRAAFEANKKNAFAAMRAGQALWHLNQSKEAIVWIKKSVNADPRLVRSYIILADFMSDRYDYVNAVAALKKALEVSRHHHGIYRGFALVELRRRNYDGAIRYAKKALELYDTDIEAILILAKAYHRKGEYELAYQYIHQAIELDPSHEEVQGASARILVGLQGTQAGIDYINELIQVMSEKKTYQRILGEIYMEEERFPEAITAFNKVLEMDPKNKPTLMAMGLILQRQKDYNGARDLLLEAAAIDPSDAKPLFMTGQIYLESGQANFALNQFERVISVNKRYPLAHYYAGKAALKLNQLDQAMAMAKEEEKMNPDIPEPYELAAEVYYKLKQYSQCAKQYQKAVMKGYQSSDAYINLGRCYRKSGALDSALSMLSEAEKRESGNPRIYKELGALYYIQGAVEKSVEAYKRYLQLNPQAKDAGRVKTIINKLETTGGQ